MTQTIMEKLRKIQAMAERGTEFEKRVAREKLDAFLDEYGLTIDDVIDSEKRPFLFKYKTKMEGELLFQIMRHVMMVREIRLQYYKENPRNIYVEMTPIQHRQVLEYWETYRKEFNTEIAKVNESVFVAFIEKHKLFSYAPAESDECDKCERPLDFELIRKLRNSMKDIRSPRVQIEGDR